ncbi:SDR family oxidoreductase [Sphingorhabdus arenilitoris]|uniref:SDR family oxidoreductase n=1 Tax=Sphingorhabdus arenilitoris TaxID=1490041 RepID=A0ABV8RH35_9SPHN
MTKVNETDLGLRERHMEISGKCAVVTGGTDGIGIEIARQLQAKGASVIVCGRRADYLEAAAAQGIEAISADLSNAKGCEEFAAKLSGRTIDILINNAGMGGNFGPGEPVDLDLTDRALFLNLNAPMHLIARMLPGLLERSEAAIVNVTSGLALAPRAGGPVYCASKAGLRSFTQALRHNLAKTNIHVIEALPPVVETAMTADRDGGKMTAKDCAAEIVHAIAANKAEANIGMVKILRLVYSISPALARKVMIRF